jgi:hypothetical protein
VQLARYSPNDGNAIRLKGNERILARVSELLERAAERAEIAVVSLIGEAEEVRKLAMATKNPSAAVAATREKPFWQE